MAVKSAVGVLSVVSSTAGLTSNLQSAMDNANDAQQHPSKYGPEQFNSQPNAIWTAIVPMFQFHDQIAKFMLEHEEQFKVPFLSEAKKEIEESIDDLTYKFLAFFIEPAVKVMREAIKNSKELIEVHDSALKADLEVDIWKPSATGSDPSHSILSKDHYSNVLNPVAGRVSLALINYATQKVVQAWEDPLLEPSAVVNSILAGFHNPYYMDPRSDVQKAMYSAVTSWWQTRTEEKKQFLNRVLSKDGVRDNLNNPVVSAAEFANDVGAGWSFLEPLPETKQRPPKAIATDTTKLIEQAGQLIADTLKKIDQGVIQVSNTVGEGKDLAGRALNDFSNSVNNTTDAILGDNPVPVLQPILQPILQEATNTSNQVQEEIDRAAQRAREEYERGKREFQNAVDDWTSWAKR